MPTKHTSPQPTRIEPSADPATERPLRRDAEANRRQILEAAGRLMAERGLATPLEDIAAAAGVGIATLYRRFPSREELIEALFQDRLAAYLTDLERAAAMADGWNALVWFLESASARQIADRALNELLEHGPSEGDLRDLLERIWPLAEILIDHAKASGRLRSDFSVSDLALVQQMLVAVGSATITPASPSGPRDTSLPPGDPRSPAGRCVAWRRYLTILLDGLVTSRRDPTPLEEAALTIDELQALHAAKPAIARRAGR